MLSNPMQRFSPYHAISSTILLPDGRVNMDPGVDSLTQGAQYSLQQLQQNGAAVSPPHPAHPHPTHPAHPPHVRPPEKHRLSPYEAARTSTVNGATPIGPVRRRISRACDQCNQLRTKCDGQHPCAHCTECGLGCEYARERKKRGKVSRKDRARQAAAQAAQVVTNASDSSHGTAGQPDSPDENSNGDKQPSEYDSPQAVKASVLSADQLVMNELAEDLADVDAAMQAQLDHSAGSLDGLPAAAIDLNGYAMGSLTAVPMMGSVPTVTMPNYSEQPYTSPFRIDTGLGAYPMAGQPASPPWLGLSSPSPQPSLQPQPQQQQQQQTQQQPQQQGYQMYHSPQAAPAYLSNGYKPAQLRYPVLEPLVPHLAGILPLSLACDLVDVYFDMSTTVQMHPTSPYVLCFLFRKSSFLHPQQPRLCQPALLASMLWLAAQTSDDPFLARLPSARGKTCQKLLELTIGLLKPLVHSPAGGASADASSPKSPLLDGMGSMGFFGSMGPVSTMHSMSNMGGMGMSLCDTSFGTDAAGLAGASGLADQLTVRGAAAFGTAGTLDDIVTYMHLATVVSASEYKGASVRWWNAAWTMARELKLGRELSLPPVDDDVDVDLPGVSEEEREERRRIWWLLYIMDRHLALCYNRPLFLLDVECEGLLQPLDETAWQNGDFPETDADRARGPTFLCRGYGMFGFFLPLMTILGEIVDLHHARNHPRFGIAFRASREWDDQVTEITRHLAIYEESLREFVRQRSLCLAEGACETGREQPAGQENGFRDDSSSPATPPLDPLDPLNASQLDERTHLVVAYGTHVMHVLHVLLAGKWDPVNLLDDDDLWISSPAFVTATGHAVAAAEATGRILEHDPGLELMPFFFGIYLLQGSFLLLLIADKLPLEASAGFTRACETIVRAHEACVVTLHTEYQRTFSRVMRSALAQVRGRGPAAGSDGNGSSSSDDSRNGGGSAAAPRRKSMNDSVDNKPHRRRRELLGLYRWTGDGTGLAL